MDVWIKAGVWIKSLATYCSWSRNLLCFCAFYHLAMQPPLYTPVDLKLHHCHAPLDSETYNLCLSLGIARRPRYIHRSKRAPSLTCAGAAQIPTLNTNCARRPRKKNIRGIIHEHLRRLYTSTISTRGFNLAHLNARSISNKTSLINDLILQRNMDILCLSETWQQPGDCIHLNMLSPPGYSYISKSRLTGRGGGLAVVYRSDLTVKELAFFSVSSFEYIAVKIMSTPPLMLLLVYRPPKPNASFLSELNELLTVVSCKCQTFIMLGDFNIHVDTNCSYTSEFISVLDCFNLTQHVDFPTHNQGHTLDLLCSFGVNEISVSGSVSGISDHNLIECSFYTTMPPPLQRKLPPSVTLGLLTVTS